MEDREYIEGICCIACNFYETNKCPIKSASPWSKYDYCNHFRNIISDRTIPEITKGETK